jgi:GxxExxY protein
METNKILFKDESYKIIGACMQVHNNLGPGFLEAVYEEALEKEFRNLSIPYNKQAKLNIFYNDEKLSKTYRADFICYEKIIVEIKAVSIVPMAFSKQLRNYLKATNLELGILINFGESSLTYKRILNKPNPNHSDKFE